MAKSVHMIHMTAKGMLIKTMAECSSSLDDLAQPLRNGLSLFDPLDAVKAAKDLMMFYTVAATAFHNDAAKNGDDPLQIRQEAEKLFLSSLAASYISFVVCFNQAGARDAIITAKERLDVLFEYHCDEYVAQMLNNLDNQG